MLGARALKSTYGLIQKKKMKKKCPKAPVVISIANERPPFQIERSALSPDVKRNTQCVP